MQGFLARARRQLGARSIAARGRAEDAGPHHRRPGPGRRATEVGKRVEPVVGQVQAQLGELPERVVQAMEPVAARVRELTGIAA